MLFRRYHTYQSQKSAAELLKSLEGRHLQVHTLDFEVQRREGDLKIIPHAELDDHIYTLPITRIRVTESEYNNTSYILGGIAITIFLILWYRLEMGYFDYIRKIAKWVKDNI